MDNIVRVLGVLALSSAIWTVIQIVKPQLFFKAEHEANLKRKRPWWYLLGGIIGLVLLVALWVYALEAKLISIWILTGISTLGSLKAVGMVFFYEKFSGGVTKAVDKMQSSKKIYNSIILTRAVLTLILSLATLYFSGMLGTII